MTPVTPPRLRVGLICSTLAEGRRQLNEALAFLDGKAQVQVQQLLVVAMTDDLAPEVVCSYQDLAEAVLISIQSRYGARGRALDVLLATHEAASRGAVYARTFEAALPALMGGVLR